MSSIFFHALYWLKNSFLMFIKYRFMGNLVSQDRQYIDSLSSVVLAIVLPRRVENKTKKSQRKKEKKMERSKRRINRNRHERVE